LYSQVILLILGEFRQDRNLKSNGINKSMHRFTTTCLYGRSLENCLWGNFKV